MKHGSAAKDRLDSGRRKPLQPGADTADDDVAAGAADSATTGAPPPLLLAQATPVVSDLPPAATAGGAAPAAPAGGFLGIGATAWGIIGGGAAIGFAAGSSAGKDSASPDTAPPAAPGSLDLAADDDSGSSASDNVTARTSGLTISGTGETGATVTLFDDANNNGVVDAGEALATATVSNGVFTADLALGSGTHALRAVLTDAAGNRSAASPTLPITIYTTFPSTPDSLDLAAADDTGNSASDNVTSRTSGLTISGRGDHGDTVTLFDDANNNGVVDAGEALATTTVSYSAFTADLTLGAGIHALRAIQTNAVGNRSAASTTLLITCDDTAPAAPGSLDLAAADDNGSSASDNVTFRTSGLTISGTGETGATVTLFDDANHNGVVDGGEALATATVSNGVFTADLALGTGTHALRAVQSDAAGNRSAASPVLSISVEAGTPLDLSVVELSLFSDAADLSDTPDVGAGMFDHITADTTPAIEFTATAGTRIDIAWNSSDFVPAGTASGRLQTAEPATALADGLHHVVVRVTDAVGNTAEQSIDISTMAGTGNPYIDSLLWGTSYSSGPTQTTVLRYAFNETPMTFGGGTLGYAWSSVQKNAVIEALGTWSAVANIRFEPTTDLNSADFVFNLGDTAYFGDPYTLGLMNVPEPYVPAGTPYDEQPGIALFNRDADSFRYLTPGGDGFNTLVHEIGHGLGLAHPHDYGGLSDVFPGVEPDPLRDGFYTKGPDGQNSHEYTVMSYNTGRYVNTGSASTPMGLDIAAIQYLYGPSSMAHPGNDSYRLDSPFDDAIDFRCLWDTGGSDTIAYYGSEACTIDLRAAPLTGFPQGGYISRPSGVEGGLTIAHGVLIENALGSTGSDTLIGNSAANTLNGGSGNDTLTGGAGADTLTGSFGADTFVLASGCGGNLLSQADQVTDFLDGIDRIGLSGLTYAQLTIEPSGTTTVIRHTASGEYLAVLLSTSYFGITAADFTTISG